MESEWSREGGVGGVGRDGVRVVQGRRSWESREGWKREGILFVCVIVEIGVYGGCELGSTCSVRR